METHKYQDTIVFTGEKCNIHFGKNRVGEVDDFSTNTILIYYRTHFC